MAENERSDDIKLVDEGKQQDLLQWLYVYKLFQSVFGIEPSIEQLDIVCSDTTRDIFLRLFGEKESAQKEIDELSKFAEKYQSNKVEVSDTLQGEYMQALIGPQALVAPPWESVYDSEARLLFQETTLDVRRRYLSERVIPEGYPHIPDDHVSLEFDFMATLTERMSEAADRNDVSECMRLASVQISFLEDHLQNWIGKFAAKLAPQKTGYYALMGRLACEVVQTNKEKLAVFWVASETSSEPELV